MSLLQNRLIFIVVIFSAVMCIAVPSLSYGFQVTKTEDTNDGTCSLEDCSLREAIIAANSSGAGSNTIYVPAGMYWITLPGSFEDEAASGDLDITNSMTIIGEGMDASIINALGEFGVHDRVFHVMAPNQTVRFENLGIYHGYTEIGVGGGVLISDAANVSFFRCHLYQNQAPTGGAIYSGNEDSNPTSNRLIITESVIEENEAFLNAGGIFVTKIDLIIDRSTIAGNSTPGPIGGLGSFSSLLNIINSTFYKNSALRASEISLGDSSVQFINSTLVASDLNVEGNIFFVDSTLPLSFYNSIIWGKCFTDTPELLVTVGGNMGEPLNSCGFGEMDIILDSDPILLPLGDFGGVTPTAPPALGSRAIDNGIFLAGTASPPSIDQRGVSRPQGYTSVPEWDIGSVERVPIEDIIKGYINDLRYLVKDPSIPSGIQQALSSKVESSDKSYNKGAFRIAVNQLEALNNSVEAQREKALTDNQANNITIISNETIMLLESKD